MSRSRFIKGEFGHDGVADLEAARRGNEAAGGRNRQDAGRDERHQARVPGGEVRREERVAARNVGEVESGGGAQPQDGTLEGVLSTATHFMLKTYKSGGILGKLDDGRLEVS